MMTLSEVAENSQYDGTCTAAKEAEEGEAFFTHVEAVILDEDKWIGFEKEVNHAIDEGHVKCDSDKHRFQS